MNLDNYICKEAQELLTALNLNKVDLEIAELIIRNAYQNGYMDAQKEAIEVIDKQFKI